MIPKIIHYCWFGKKPKPKKVSENIGNWKRLNPYFEIKEWNEDNFNIELIPFVSQAYKERKYAFVSDVVRLYALIHEGGIYLDTDVELVQAFPEHLLKLNSFVGFEQSRQLMIGTAVIGSEKENPFWQEFYNKYESMNFKESDGSYNQKPNVNYLTEKLVKMNVALNNKKQEIAGVHIYPREYFSPKNYATKRIGKTSKTIAIHHFSETWIPLWKRILLRIWVPFSMKYPRVASKIKTLC